LLAQQTKAGITVLKIAAKIILVVAAHMDYYHRNDSVYAAIETRNASVFVSREQPMWLGVAIAYFEPFLYRKTRKQGLARLTQRSPCFAGNPKVARRKTYLGSRPQ
jgi:hypothetical protein